MLEHTDACCNVFVPILVHVFDVCVGGMLQCGVWVVCVVLPAHVHMHQTNFGCGLN